jgi:H+-translocating NAD(P) transhydrogenase subunit alpha
VRPAAKEQVESLGAKFIAVEDDEFRQAETTTGYAKPMSDTYKEKQAALIAAHVPKQDVIITTAQLPGRQAPVLLTQAMVESLKRGSVIVDLAVDRGGNCAVSKPGDVIDYNGVSIVGHLNLPARIAATASQLYAKNVLAFINALLNEENHVALEKDTVLSDATCLTRGGLIVHPLFAPKSEAAVAYSQVP